MTHRHGRRPAVVHPASPVARPRGETLDAIGEDRRSTGPRRAASTPPPPPMRLLAALTTALICRVVMSLRTTLMSGIGAVPIDVMVAGDGGVEEHRWVDVDESVRRSEQGRPGEIHGLTEGVVFLVNE